MEKSFHFTMSAEPPFRLDFTVWALRRRPVNIIDRFDGHRYRRVLSLEDRPMEIEASQPDRSRSLIEVTVYGRDYSPESQSAAAGFLELCLGTKSELSEFYSLSARDGEIGRMISWLRGFKPVRFPSVFEALVNGIACQQISLAAGLSVLSRLAGKAGMAFSSLQGVVHAFPRPSDVVRLGEKGLREVGFSTQKAKSLTELSRAVVEEKLDLENLEGLDNGRALELLRGMRGIGRWTAEYALLRGLGRLDVFPGDDVGARKKLLSVLGREGPLSYEETRQAVDSWQPYAGFVYLHLLLADLVAHGYVDGT